MARGSSSCDTTWSMGCETKYIPRLFPTLVRCAVGVVHARGADRIGAVGLIVARLDHAQDDLRDPDGDRGAAQPGFPLAREILQPVEEDADAAEQDEADAGAGERAPPAAGAGAGGEAVRGRVVLHRGRDRAVAFADVAAVLVHVDSPERALHQRHAPFFD